MAQDRIDNYSVNSPKHIDNRALKNGTTPYATKQEAHDTIGAYRYQTQVVSVLKNGVPTEYWYRDAFASVDDLIEKAGAGTTTDLTAVNARIDTKATLPDGLTVIGTVTMSIDTASIANFQAIYQGNHISLASATVLLDPKDASSTRPPYDRYDSIYYNPSTSAYGKVTGSAVENPVKPIPVIPSGTFRIADILRKVDGTNVITYGPTNTYVTVDGTQTVTGLKNFDGGLSSNKELLNVNKPIQTTKPFGFFVNYENCFHNNSVLFVDDALASFGKVVKVPQGMSRLQPHAIYGPYENGFWEGDWAYEFQLRVSDNTITTDVIQFDIAVGGVTWGSHFINIKPNQFPDTTSYKTFRIPFTATKGTGYEFRIHILPDANPIDFYFNYGIAKPVAETPTINPSDISNFIDVTGASSGQVLKYNGSKFVPGIDNVGSGSGGGDMFAATYDSNSSGVVDDAEKLNNHPGTYYLDLTNATGALTADKTSEGTNNHLFTTAYKTKVDGIQAGATQNSSDAFLLDLTNATNFLNADKVVSGTNNRVYTTAESVKLGGISAQATKNNTDAYLTDLGNSTGSLDPTKIGYDATHRPVSDTEKTYWNNKLDASAAPTPIAVQNNLTTTVAGSALDATKGKFLNDSKADKTGTSDIEITDPTKGYILACADDNTRHRLTVSKNGTNSYTLNITQL